jgi:hypothetical protein
MIEDEKDLVGLFYITIVIFAVALIGVSCLNSIYKKNTEQLPQNKPIDRQKITSIEVTGNVESIHPWGRTEVVPMKSVELKYFEFCDEWVMYGDVVQPVDRKDYFMPVMNGRLNFSVRDLTQTWIEYGSYATGPEEKAETYEDFRVADIRIKEGKIINILYKHYRLDSNKSWSIIAVWEAIVNPDVSDKENQHE